MKDKSESKKSVDARIDAANEIYAIARQEADLEMAKLRAEMEVNKDENISIGVIRANKAHRDYCNFLDAVVLYRAHKSKSYKQAGLTWENFCEVAGYPRRTAETLIAEVAPLFDAVGQNLPVLAGITVNDIRWLGRTGAADSAGLSEDGKTITIGDDQIPNTTEDIMAYINHQKTILKETALDIKAKDRVIADKEKNIQKLHKTLDVLEGKAKMLDLTPEEEGFLKKVEFLRTGFDGYLLQLDPRRLDDLFQDTDPTPRMRAAYITTLDYMKKQILTAHDFATQLFGDAIMCPEDAWPGLKAISEGKKDIKETKRES